MYINDNFLHAPSPDLSRETVKALSSIMLAQAQECVCQTQIREGKTGKIVAKLANQAALLFSAAIEGVTEHVSQGVFERVWLNLCQVSLPNSNLRSNINTFYPWLSITMHYPTQQPNK